MGLGTILDSQFERLTWLKEPRVHREADSAHERVESDYAKQGCGQSETDEALCLLFRPL